MVFLDVLQLRRRQQQRLLQQLLQSWRLYVVGRRLAAAALVAQQQPLLRHGWKQLRLHALSSRVQQQTLQRGFAALLQAVNMRRRLEWCQACATLQQTVSAAAAAANAVAAAAAASTVRRQFRLGVQSRAQQQQLLQLQQQRFNK